MATSQTKTVAATNGFTLIELMVVIVIIGILVNYVAISFGRNAPADQLNMESERLKSLIHIAGEEALLRSAFIGVDLLEDSYAFLRLEDGEWQSIDDNLFRERKLPQEIEITVIAAQPAGDDDDDDDDEEEKEKRTPEIILLNSGEMTPFDIKITSLHLDEYYRLIGNEVGELKLDRISP
jgi:general secretion pathway protein H